VSIEHLERLVKILIRAFGENPEERRLAETPGRALRGWSELLSGYGCDDRKFYKIFEFSSDEFILVKNIEFTSICEHHLLPFHGRVTIGYTPNGKILGLSKFARVVDCFSKRLQLQEKLTEDISNSIVNNLRPKNLFTVIKATHCCMICRGVMKQRAEVLTLFTHGKFQEYDKLDIVKLIN
jgi:GTP cyclohydrolase I